MGLYPGALAVCAVLTALITIRANTGAASRLSWSADFQLFQRTFLAIYYVSMTADWLHGPYVYALYSSYGFSKHDIAVLFVGGFGASMIFGTFVGAAADKMGRRKFCQLYCLLYITSCATKHANHYWVLMLGRVLGGIAASLLFSSFDSWLICEHNNRGFESPLLSQTFSLMYFGNSIAAILAGVMAESAVDSLSLTPAAGIWYFGGYCTPFDLSACFLVVALALITANWNENYGSTPAFEEQTMLACASTASTVLFATQDVELPMCWVAAWKQLLNDKRIMLCGAAVSLFEGSMYIFVFNWTPALSSNSDQPLPSGLIFICFMVACMGGSSLFAVISRYHEPVAILRLVFLVAAISVSLPCFFTSNLAVLIGFLLFEGCVGIYFPAMGTVKSQIVPEEARATIYNIFRIPLNAIVLAVLLNHMETATAFFCCGVLLAAAFASMVLLSNLGPSSHAAEASVSDVGGLEDGKANGEWKVALMSASDDDRGQSKDY